MSKVLTACVVFVLVEGLFLVAQNVQNPPNTVTLRGKIVFQGALPTAPIQMGSDPYCASLGQRNYQGSEDVMVYVKPMNQASFSLPGSTVTLEWRDCRFVPHTLSLQVGQKLLIRNSDGTAHNAHAWSAINQPFNISQVPGAEVLKTFEKEEVSFAIRDDIHGWEVANVGVFGHPYHTVSKLNDVYQLAIPAGPYEIIAWHERLGTVQQSFEAKGGETRVLDLVFK